MLPLVDQWGGGETVSVILCGLPILLTPILRLPCLSFLLLVFVFRVLAILCLSLLILVLLPLLLRLECREDRALKGPGLGCCCSGCSVFGLR